MNTRRARDRFMPWGGIALGTLGFFVAHQLGGDATFQDCRVGSPLVVVIGTLVGLAIIAAGALSSWTVHRNKAEPAARQLVAAVSLMACIIFTIGVLLPSIAAMIIPRCWE
jgi:hypothetical protein